MLVAEAPCRIITESLTHCHLHKFLRINAYVLMPTHLHAIVCDAEHKTERLGKTLTEFRKFTGRQLSDYCVQHAPACFTDCFRARAATDRERRFWQPSRHPEAIVGERFWRQKLDYLHDNPRRKGLVREAAAWRFSSAAFYVSEGRELCDVPISLLEW